MELVLKRCLACCVSLPSTQHLCRRERLNVWKVHLLANLLTPGLALALGPVPAHLLLQEQRVLRCQKQTVADLAIVPDDRLVAVDVKTLLGRVLDVAEWIVGVGGGSVPICTVSSFSKIGKEKVYRHCQK